MKTKIIKNVGNIKHVLVAALVIFLFEQLGQLPIARFNHHLGHDLIYGGISLIIFATIIAWMIIMLYQNRKLNTSHSFYNSLVKIIFNIALVLICSVILLEINLHYFHLNIGGTTENQKAINAMGSTPLGLIFEWLLVVLIGPLAEEFLFRYAIIQPKSLHDQKSRTIRLIVSIFTFAALHMLVQFMTIRSANQFHVALYGLVQYSIISVIFSWNYYRRNDIHENIAMHIIYNLLVCILNAS